MTLPDFFLAVNAGGVRLARVGNELKLRGPANSITPELAAAASAHKQELLALLPDEHADPDTQAERKSLEQEGCRSGIDPARVAVAVAEWDQVTQAVAAPTGSLARFDWRLEWLIQLGTIHLRMRRCKDEEVRDRLQRLADLVPDNEAEWSLIGEQMLRVTYELKQLGKFPDYHWPARGEVKPSNTAAKPQVDPWAAF
jgi:hypothetical protein